VVDSAAVFLFGLFVGNTTWSVENQKEIRNKLGPFPASAAEEAYKCVLTIIDLVPRCKDLDYSEPKQEPQEEFGKKFNFFFHNQLGASLEGGVANGGTGHISSGGYDSLSDDEEENNGGQSELLTNILCQSQANDFAAKSKGSNSNPSDLTALPCKPVASSLVKYSREWLQAKCQSCCGNRTDWKDFYSAIFDYLSSGDESSSIENDVGWGQVVIYE